jgi:ribonuclease HI
MRKVHIYTDGSCLGNPGVGAYGCVILDDEKEFIISGAEPHTTNNRMELRAIIESLRWIKNECTGQSVQLFSDSNLYIQSITKNWKRKTNLDLWEEFDELYQAVQDKKNKVEWTWVRGHAGNKYNQKVDRIAVAEAKKLERSL